MFSVGCIQAQRCNTNACPVGVTTQDPKLQRALVVPDKAERVYRYHKNTVHAVAEFVAAMGLDHPSQLAPHHVFRRMSPTQVASLDEIYLFLTSGQLLDGTAPERMQRYWNESTSAQFQFDPQPLRRRTAPLRPAVHRYQECNMIDLATYELQGDKKNSEFFNEYLSKVYERRDECGLGQIVDRMAACVVQVSHGDGIKYLAELAVMGPYRLVEARLSDTHRVYILKSRPEFPRMIVLEPLSPSFTDEITRWNNMYPLSRRKPNTRYVGEVYRSTSIEDVREALEPQNIRFVEAGDTPNPFYAGEHLAFTFLSDFTYNRVGYVDVDLDDAEALGLGELITLQADEREKLERADALQERTRDLRPRARHRPHGDPDPLGRPRGRAARVHDDGALLLLGRLQHHGDELVDERHAPSRRR